MDQKNAGPTAFDINKPQTYGATPSARPVIVGHRPVMPDPMITPHETPPLGGSKINVKVDELRSTSDIMGGEPQLSPPFKSHGDSESATQRAPYMPVSDLTGIDQDRVSASARLTKASEVSDDQVVTTDPKPSVFGSSSHDFINEGGGPKHHKSRTKFWLLPLFMLIVLAGAYAAIDKGLVLSNINLPVHIFKKSGTVTTNSQPTTPSIEATIPSGFTSTKLVEAGLSFAYPTAWGAPAAAVDQGFSKRSASAKPDASHAYVITFPDNKDVELAVTSAKILSQRSATQFLYYDYLGWCVGTVDGKYYAGALNFLIENDVDSPSTVACNQGPLNNVTKLTNDTIVQTNLKSTDGKVVGDIYTRNLTNSNFTVIRARDAAMKNAEQIKILLGTVANLSSQ